MKPPIKPESKRLTILLMVVAFIALMILVPMVVEKWKDRRESELRSPGTADAGFDIRALNHNMSVIRSGANTLLPRSGIVTGGVKLGRTDGGSAE